MMIDRRATKRLLCAGAFAAMLVSAVGWTAQSLGPPAPLVPADPQGPQGMKLCREQRQSAERAEAEAGRRRQIAVVARLEGADPSRDAAAAAARGDFRLIRGETMGGTYALGVECRTPADSSLQPLTLATRFYSDVPGSCETRGGADRCRTERLLDSYGPAYNRALVSNPLYPYRDLCRPVAGRTAVLPLRIDDPVRYGFPDLATTSTPLDLHEAARRGSAPAVARMIAAAGAGGVDRADPWGLTPLAWAVIRRRPEVAARLLAAGANPIGAGCDEPGRPESPLRLALRSGQEALARRMMTPAAMQRLRPWPGGLVEAAAQGGSAAVLSQMLREPREGPAANRLGQSPGGSLPASSAAVLDAYAAGLCWRHPLPAGARLRMIGVYEGGNGSGSWASHDMRAVTVTVAASPRPAFLVLSAYEPVEWRIVRAPGVRLAGVLAVGMHRPRVTGAGAGVPVLINDRRDHCPVLRAATLHAYTPDEQQSLAEAVERMVGRPVDDRQGRYSATAFELR